MDNNKYLSYLIITPAYNEEQFIEKTIQSVINQTVLPVKWIIVSDGSTDKTDEIVSRYTSKYKWIELLRMPEHDIRNFASKVHCFNAAYEKCHDLNYDIIGNLDADISFDKDYFTFLLKKFDENPSLGVAGTPFVENSKQSYDYNFTNIEHVSGACQLFRKECFKEIGGYVPIESGGIDWTAVTTARMKGWKTRTFTEKQCTHYRQLGTGNSRTLMTKFRYGKKDYSLGGHPVWEIFRAIYQMKYKPYIFSGLFMFSGYLWAALCRDKRPISKNVIKFNQKEQMQRLKKVFLK